LRYFKIRGQLMTGHSRFPVKENSNIIGFVHAKDLFGLVNKKGESFRDFIRPAYFVDAEKKLTHNSGVSRQRNSTKQWCSIKKAM